MNGFGQKAALGLAVSSFVLCVYLLVNAGRETGSDSNRPGDPRAAPELEKFNASIQSLQLQVDALRAELLETPPESGAPGGGEARAEPVVQSDPQVNARLQQMERQIARLQSAFDGISMEDASAEREELFRSDAGAAKADEYFEAGKWSIAGEGYLKYLETHPDDPDIHDILRKARDAFSQGGYTDRAILIQTQLAESFPEHRLENLKTLAAMEKSAGRYDDAIKHITESTEMDQHESDRLWSRLHWAWYHQLRDGPRAGLDAYKTVENEIETAGFRDHKLGNRVREKIAEMERLASGK